MPASRDGYVPRVPEPRLLNGRYELGELIGAGGSAQVHRARDRMLDRTVAVKLLDAAAARSADPAAHERFLREARTSAGFAHRHSVATYDAGDADGQLFLVMELVDGPSLAQLIASEAPLGADEIVRVGAQVLSALEAAHAAGLIHRDVKPANVLLDRNGDAKLADFGIAKRFDELTDSLTAAGTVVGTRDYLAPEQAAGAEIGPAVDLFALGVVLYEMATGERPPRPADGTGADPRALRPDLPAGIAAAIATALSASPSNRFPSAAAMATALSGELPPTELSVATPTRTTPETRVMPAAPAAARDHAGARAGAAANGVRAGVRAGAQTAVMDSPTERDPVGAGARWMLIASLVLVVLVATVVLGSRTPDDTAGGDVTAPTSVAQLAVAPPTTAPAASDPTTAPTSAASTVAATPPSTEPPPTDLVPGFADTDDLDTFVERLRDAKEVAGKQAKKLSDALRKIRDEDDPDERAARIEDLSDDLDEWVGKGELEPAVADRAREFLADL